MVIDFFFNISAKDQSGSSDKKKIVPNFELLQCVDFDLTFSAPRDGVTPDLHLGNYYDTSSDQAPDDSPGDLANPVFDPIDDWGGISVFAMLILLLVL